MKQESRKQEIINTAAKLFTEKGYSAVTMRDLATSMGIKAASLYNHINSKQEILQEIIISLAEEFTEGMEVIKLLSTNSHSKLSQIIALHIKITSENIDGMASLNNDWMHLENKLEYYLELRNGYEANYLRIIEDGITNKEIKPVKPDVLMFSMLSTLRSLYLWLPKTECQNIDATVLQLSEVLLNGVNIQKI